VKAKVIFTNKKRTICEVLRECEDLLCEYENDFTNFYTRIEPDVLRKKLKEVHDMAKRMNGKLIEYKADYDNSMGIDNSNYEKNKALRKKRSVVE
jgi:hypothetical protein